MSFNQSLPGQNRHHLADGIVKCTFLNEKVHMLIAISLRFVPIGPIGNKSALDQVIAWWCTGDKPLPESMLTQFINAYIWHWEEMS